MTAAREQDREIVNSANELINREIKKFNVSDAAIAELADRYLPMTIKDLNDKDGYQAIKAGRQVIKGLRVDVDKRRKELTADAVALQRGINKEAGRITDLLEPIETHLQGQEQIFDDEKERIRVEKEQARQRQFDIRLQTIMDLGFAFNGFDYKCAYSPVIFNNNVLTHLTVESFSKTVEELMPLYDKFQIAEAENIRLEQEQKAEAEKQRLYQTEQAEQRRKDTEAENARIAEENRVIAAENARLQDELIKQKLIANKAAEELIKSEAIKSNAILAKFCDDGANAQRANEERLLNESSGIRTEKFVVVKTPANDSNAIPALTPIQKDQERIKNYMLAIENSNMKNFDSAEGEQFYKYMKSRLNEFFQKIEKDLQYLGV